MYVQAKFSPHIFTNKIWLIYRHFDSSTLLFSAHTILSGTCGLCGVGFKGSHSAKLNASYLSVRLVVCSSGDYVTYLANDKQ
jgi:hypothetical protein